MGPVRDQGVSGLCFAYEAADLVSHKIRSRVSALDLALSYFQTTKLNKMSDIYNSGGETPQTIKGAEALGFCPEQEMPSNETLIGTEPDQDGKIQQAFLWLEKNSWNSREALETARTIFPLIAESEWATAMRIAKKKDRLAFLQAKNCRVRIPLESIRLVNKELKEKSDINALIQIINQQLSKENPVGVGVYAADMFAQIEERDDGHAATLVGRRWNSAKNTCEYQIRDTFGEQCVAYKKDFECNKGYIWVDTKFLKKNLFEVEYLE